MGFDAGSIKGKLELDRTQFDEALDEAERRAEEFEKNRITAKLSLDNEEFDADAADAEAIKKELGKSIEIPASIDNAELAASAVEAEAIIDAVKESARDSGTTGILTLDPAQLGAEAREVKALIEDISATASEAAAGDGLVNMLLGSGASADDALAALKGLGFSAAEAKSMISAASLTDALLPSSSDLAQAMGQRIEDAFYQLKNAGFDVQSLYSIVGSERALAGDFRALAKAEQLALPPGGRIAIGPDGQQAALGPGPMSLGSIFGEGGFYDDIGAAARAEESALRTAALRESKGSESLVNALLGAGIAGEDLHDALSGMGMTAQEADAAINAVLGDAEKEGSGILASIRSVLSTFAGKNGGGVGGFLQSLGGAGSGATAGVNSAANSIPLVAGGLPGLSVLIPMLGALGLGAGGAIAGTAIGSAGTIWAAIPGLLSLLHGYSAYQNQQTLKNGNWQTPGWGQAYAAVKAETPGAAAVGGAIGGLVSGTKPLLDGLEGAVNPQIVAFLGALTTAMQSVAPFAVIAASAMGGFFKQIDSGLSGGGFKSFMASMAKDVGPIMQDFGGTILHLGDAFGHFLTIFGSGPAQMVGQWFDTESGKLATFMQHAHISPSFMAGAKTVFHTLATAIDVAWQAGTKLARALAPIGLAILRIADPVLRFAGDVIKMIPVKVITDIAGFILAVMGIAKVFSIVGKAIELGGLALDALTGPVGLVILALVLLGLGAYELAKHWKQVWGDIKNWFDDAVRFLRSGLGTLIIALTGPLAPLLLLALHWQQAWSFAQTVWHGFDNDVIHPLVNFFTNSVPHAWGVFTSSANTAWQWFDNNIVHPLASFFNTTIGGAIKTAESAWETGWNAMSSTIHRVWQDIQPIINAIKGAVSSVTGPLATIVSDAGKVANFIAHPFGLATGGSFSGNGPILVGENGPELMYPKSPGYVVPNNRLGFSSSSSAGGVTIYVDARGATDPQAIRSAATSGVHGALPALRNALERGSGAMAGMA